MRLLTVLGWLAIIGLGTTGCGKKDEPKQAANGGALKGVVFGDPKPEPKPEPPPMPADGGLQVKPNPPPKGLVQSVRGAATRPERQNELRQIGIFFKLFADERNGKNPSSDEEFINYIKRDAGGIAKAIQEKYYILNLKVNLRDSNNVIAYESLIDAAGHQAVRAGGTVEPIPVEELRKLVMP
jgi:hypothetical protein